MVCVNWRGRFEASQIRRQVGHAVHSLFWYWFAGVCFTHRLVGIFARTCGCGFFGADFLVRIFGCGFWGADSSQICGADFFRGFCDGLCGFWVQISFCGFFWLFSRRKNPEKIPSRNPTEKSSPKI